MNGVRSCIPFWRPNDSATHIDVEDFKAGYPRFTSLIAAHDPFLLCRRFTKLRARILLLKQDKLSVLEQRLDEIDESETCLLFLGKLRNDRNPDRLSALTEIEACLADYDQFAERTHRILSFARANERDVHSLWNWLQGTGCIAREEVQYLAQHRELISLAPTSDSATIQLETWVEDGLIRVFSGVRNWSSFRNVSVDANVYIYSGNLIKRIAKVIVVLLITLALLVPVIICNIFEAASIRIVVIILSTILFLLILSRLTRARTMEMTVAASTYVTVLVVFVSGSNISILHNSQTQ